jgi:hypothetical protein
MYIHPDIAALVAKRAYHEKLANAQLARLVREVEGARPRRNVTRRLRDLVPRGRRSTGHAPVSHPQPALPPAA